MEAYASGLYFRKDKESTQNLVDEAGGYVEQGFRAMKMKVGLGVQRDTTRVQAVREAIGDDVRLMIDANHAYDASMAIMLGIAVDACNPSWFEEPVPPEDIDGYVEVRSRLRIPIAGGEAEYTKFGFRNLIDRRAVDIVQPDACSAGGITEVKKIAALSSAHNIQLIPHVWGSPVAIAAGLQIIASLPDCPSSLYSPAPLLEFDRTEHPIREELAEEPFELEKGFIKVPDGPGLGITINKRKIQQYRK